MPNGIGTGTNTVCMRSSATGSLAHDEINKDELLKAVTEATGQGVIVGQKK